LRFQMLNASKAMAARLTISIVLLRRIRASAGFVKHNGGVGSHVFIKVLALQWSADYRRNNLMSIYLTIYCRCVKS